jgi:hypothetical protein
METFSQKAKEKTETKEFFIKTSEPIPSTNPIDFKSEEISSTEEPEIELIKLIPSKNPRHFDSDEEIDQFMKSLNIKGTRE